MEMEFSCTSFKFLLTPVECFIMWKRFLYAFQGSDRRQPNPPNLLHHYHCDTGMLFFHMSLFLTNVTFMETFIKVRDFSCHFIVQSMRKLFRTFGGSRWRFGMFFFWIMVADKSKETWKCFLNMNLNKDCVTFSILRRQMSKNF